MNYQQIAKQAKAVRTTVATASTNTKNAALLAIRDAIAGSRSQILKANQKDLEAGRDNGLDEALLDRLELNNARIDAMIEGIELINVFMQLATGNFDQIVFELFFSSIQIVF